MPRKPAPPKTSCASSTSNHTRIDRLRVVRELPEVQDLEDELKDCVPVSSAWKTTTTRTSDHAYQMQIKDSQEFIEKYTEQQNNVRNNREFESLQGDEYQTLDEPQKASTCKAVEQKAEGPCTYSYNQRQADLDAKKANSSHWRRTQAGGALQKHSDKTPRHRRPSVNSYCRIWAAKNGLAVAHRASEGHIHQHSTPASN